MAAVARYLADTSALGRLEQPVVKVVLGPLVEYGLVATCGMVELEVLFSARSAAEYRDRRKRLVESFESLATPDEVWDRARDVQAAFARRGAHRGVSLPDLLVAATAERHGVTVLHYDRDYELIASVTGQPVRWVVEPGAV